jgi:formylglycine-generating enzyme required for sulfatase activity
MLSSKTLLLLFVFGLFVGTAHANNIQISNLTLTGKNTTSDFVDVKFDLSWENSWRTSSAPNNWDAAWVFIKFRVGASDPTFTSVSSSGTTITVSSTANLRVGMPVTKTAGTGVFAANTVISSITNATQFVVSAAPTTALSGASITCRRIWEHAFLNNTGHTASSGSTIDAGLLTPGTAFNATTNPALGTFIYRSVDGAGTNNFTNTQLRWNYGANGVFDYQLVSVRIFATEMVYVAQGAFYVGDGQPITSYSFPFYRVGTNTAWLVENENAITVANTAGNLYYNPTPPSFGNGGDRSGPIPATFPKGFNAFYCMKYEITQKQYRDFLNSLTYFQQSSRTARAPSSVAGTGAIRGTYAWRNGIDIKIPGNATTLVPATYACNTTIDALYDQPNDGQWLACNYISYMDLAAFLDWAALRPMTEFEIEKAARGPEPPLATGYSWGTQFRYVNGITTLTDMSTINEGISSNQYATDDLYGNFVNGDQNNIRNPSRVGIAAAHPNNNNSRVRSGASYWGIMELSSNIGETTVTVGHSAGRSYTGLHGNGGLSSLGHADVTAWPGFVSGQVTGANGSGLSIRTGWVSDAYSRNSPISTRLQGQGGRGVRSAP